MKFDIKLKDEICDMQHPNRRYKVRTIYGEPAEIVKWDCKGKYPILAVIDDGSTDDAGFFTREGFSITSMESSPKAVEPDLVLVDTKQSEFEKAVETYCTNLQNGIDKIGDVKKIAKNLLKLARKELEKEMLEEIDFDKYPEDYVKSHFTDGCGHAYDTVEVKVPKTQEEWEKHPNGLVIERRRGTYVDATGKEHEQVSWEYIANPYNPLTTYFIC